MVPQLILLSTPRVNLEAFGKAFEQAIGVAPFRNVDSHSRKFSDDAKFIAALAEPVDPLVALRDSVHELNHLFYSFMVLSDLEVISEITAKSPLKAATYKVLDNSRLSIVSGSLSDWYLATLEFLSERSSFNLRHLFDSVLLAFDKLGLAEVWYEKRRRSLKDKTFLLEDKR